MVESLGLAMAEVSHGWERASSFAKVDIGKATCELKESTQQRCQ